MNDDPRFQNDRLVERNLGPAETTRLARGEALLSEIVGPRGMDEFYQAFSARCGDALPTALIQLLDFMERRCNAGARQRDMKMAAMVRAWREPGMMDSIYLNACVEEYARDKAWAQATDAQKERAISLARFGEKFSEETARGTLDKAKEAGVAVLLAAGLSFATDSMALVEKLPMGLRKPLEEAAKSGSHALSMLHGVSPHSLVNAALGIGAAAAIIFGKAALSAAWTAAMERRARVSVSCDIPRSLAVLDRDHAWEPHVLGVPGLAHGLHMKESPPVWDKDSLHVLSANRHAIRAHAAQVAVEVKQAWGLLTHGQRESAKDLPARRAIAMAAAAILAMREKAELGGYGLADYGRLDLGVREAIVRECFEKAQASYRTPPAPAPALDPAGVKERLLSRRPSLLAQPATALASAPGSK